MTSAVLPSLTTCTRSLLIGLLVAVDHDFGSLPRLDDMRSLALDLTSRTSSPVLTSAVRPDLATGSRSLLIGLLVVGYVLVISHDFIGVPP